MRRAILSESFTVMPSSSGHRLQLRSTAAMALAATITLFSGYLPAAASPASTRGQSLPDSACHSRTAIDLLWRDVERAGKG